MTIKGQAMLAGHLKFYLAAYIPSQCHEPRLIQAGQLSTLARS
jgi:hypothetical protein